MSDGLELSRAVAGLLLLLGMVWLPGYAIHRLLLGGGRNTLTSVAAAPLLGTGLLYCLGEALSSMHIPVNEFLPLAAGASAVLWLLATRPRRAIQLFSPTAKALWCSAGIGTAIWTAGIGSLWRVPPHNDGYNHGFFIRRIVETETLRPDVVFTHDVLLGGHGGNYYPLALHQQAAFLVQILHLDIAPAWTLTSLSLTVLALPAGMVLLVRQLFPDRPRVALASAVVSVLSPGLTYSTAWWGGYTLAAGFALTPIALVLVLEASKETSARRLLTAGLAMSGLIGVHTSEWSFVCVAAAALLVARSPLPGVKSLSLNLFRLGTAVVTGLVLLTPVVVQLAGGWQERAGLTKPRGLPLRTALVELIGQFYFTPPATPVIVIALWVGVISCLVARRARAWLALWSLFGLLYLWLATHPDPLINALTSTWYSDQVRVAYILSFLAIPVIAFAVAGSSKSTRVELRIASTVLGVLMLTTTSWASVQSVHQDYEDFSLVGPDERAAFAYLRQHVRPGQHVLNQHQDGSPWMYSLYGVAPVFALKTNNYESDDWAQALYLSRHAALAGRDSRTDSLLEHFNVQYVYVGDKVFSTEKADLRAVDLESSTQFRLVFSRGHAHVFELERASAAAR